MESETAPENGNKPDHPGTSEQSTKEPGNYGGILKIIILVILVIGLSVAVYFLPVKRYFLDALTWVEGLGAWGPVFVAVFYILACLLFLPGSILTLGAGFLFKLTVGTITVSIGSTLGACAAFLAGRFLARGWIARKVSANTKFAAIDNAVGEQGFKIVLLTRLSPFFPFNMLNWAYGLTKVPFWKYAIASWIGMLPGTIMYVAVGAGLSSVAEAAAGKLEKSAGQQVFFWIGIAFAIIVAILVGRIAKNALRVAISGQRRKPAGEGMPLPKEHDVPPMDEYNKELVENTHPPAYVNPEPAERYNLVVIGAGTAGLVAAAGAAGLGAKVALIERHLMGGDCLNVGCVPSKGIIAASRIVADVRKAGEYGIKIPGGTEVDFGAVMERMRKLRAGISKHDSVERFTGLGIDVFLGDGKFSGPDAIEVDGKTLRFKKAVIATGARASYPPVEGLKEAGFLTNETIFNLTDRPDRLAVIGAGPIGCELAQAFNRLGSKVHLIHRNNRIMNREDPDASKIVQDVFEHEGVNLVLDAEMKRVEGRDGEKTIYFERRGKEESLAVDEILIGVGRAPNVENLNLEAAGVKYDLAGVIVDDRLRTTNSRVFAVGDVCSKYKFTYAADAMARIVIQNALFHGGKKASALNIPWCTYTDPEVAHVGLYENEAEGRGMQVKTFMRYFKDVDRAILDGETEGFVKILVKKGTDKILGATIVSRTAGNMISEITLAMAADMGLGTIAGVIHPYPTQGEAIKQVGDAYNHTRLTPFVKGLFSKWLAWTR